MTISRKKATPARRKLKPKLLDRAAIVEIFERLKKRMPNPRTELEYTNPYTLLVAVTLSAQMTDTGVNKATKELFRKVDSPQKMARLGEEKLLPYIKTINFHRTKAKNVIKQAQMLIAQFNGQVPDDYDDLVSLPGVGNKTAKVMLSEIFGQHTIAVDTHVFRVANRLGMVSGMTPEAVEEQLLDRVPEKYKRYTHHWLLLHGRYICKARVPECWHCPLIDLCLYPDKNLVPPKTKKA